jgi:hypothetical protein
MVSEEQNSKIKRLVREGDIPGLAEAIARYGKVYDENGRCCTRKKTDPELIEQHKLQPAWESLVAGPDYDDMDSREKPTPGAFLTRSAIASDQQEMLRWLRGFKVPAPYTDVSTAHTFPMQHCPNKTVIWALENGCCADPQGTVNVMFAASYTVEDIERAVKAAGGRMDLQFGCDMAASKGDIRRLKCFHRLGAEINEFTYFGAIDSRSYSCVQYAVEHCPSMMWRHKQIRGLMRESFRDLLPPELRESCPTCERKYEKSFTEEQHEFLHGLEEKWVEFTKAVGEDAERHGVKLGGDWAWDVLCSQRGWDTT